MKHKNTIIFLIALMLSVTLIAAATFTISKTVPSPLTEANKNTTFTITNPSSNTEILDLSVTLPSTITDGKGHSITPTSTTLNFNNVNPGTDSTVTIGYTGVTTNFIVGEYTGVVTINAEEDGVPTNNLSLTETLKFQKTFCKAGDAGDDLKVRKVKLDNSDGADDEWSPLDRITLEVEVKNNGDERIKDINVEIALLDSDGNDIIDDMDDFDDEQIDLGSIKDGKDETATYTFTVPPDFEEGSYKLVVKAFSEDLKEENACSSTNSDLSDDLFWTIDGERETDEEKHVIVGKARFSPTPAQCGETVQLSAEVFNVGDTDYADQVKVTLKNAELGVDLERIVRGDLDEGDSEVIDFDFNIPTNAKEKGYVFEFRTFYDYDEDDDVYDIVSEDNFPFTLSVQGGCSNVVVKNEETNVQINAQLDSSTPDAIPGKQVVVKATLKNTGIKTTNYVISVSGNSGWSNLVSIDPQSVIIDAGASRDVWVTLDIDPDASGRNGFVIRASFDGKEVTQPFEFTISPVSTDYDSKAVADHLRNNWFIYLIVIVNVILIIAIILVIRRIVSPRPGL